MFLNLSRCRAALEFPGLSPMAVIGSTAKEERADGSERSGGPDNVPRWSVVPKVKFRERCVHLGGISLQLFRSFFLSLRSPSAGGDVRVRIRILAKAASVVALSRRCRIRNVRLSLLDRRGGIGLNPFFGVSDGLMPQQR
jgi:hypothetical protein